MNLFDIESAYIARLQAVAPRVGAWVETLTTNAVVEA